MRRPSRGTDHSLLRGVVLGGSSVVLLLLAAGCGTTEPSSAGRLAILPFDNLSDDASLDWMGRAVTEVLAGELAESRSLRPVRVMARREAAAAGATRVLHGYFVVRAGRVRLAASLEDFRRNRIACTFSAEGSLSAGLLPLANALGRWIDPQARAFGTQNEKALESYVKAVAARDPETAAAEFERAIAADPDFGDAYVAWAQWLAARNDRAGAQRVLALAASRAGKIGETSRLRLDLLAADLSRDQAGKLRSLRALAQTTPSDVAVLQSLAREESRAHNYAGAAGWFRRVVELDSSNALAWNELGYAEMDARKLEGALQAFREYQRLAPAEANPLDSLGDAYYYFGRFGEAEKHYLQAHERNPAFLAGACLYKAAWARLLSGDLAGADDLFRRYVEARKAAGDPLLAYRQAQWLFSNGRRREAIEVMSRFAAETSLPDPASVGHSQLAVWLLETGEPALARHHAERAVRKAASPPVRALAGLCRFLTQPAAAPAELEAAAAVAFPGPAADRTRKDALAVALLLKRHFGAAVPLLADLHQRANPVSGEPFNVLLAWALVETGRPTEALPLLETYNLPRAGGESILHSLAFPGELLLRSQVLEKMNRAEEAGRVRDLYRRLSGR